MSFAWPLGFLLGLLALPLVLLYFLKLRRRKLTVSSVLPWKRALEDRRANAPWEKLRRNLLLLLQLIVLAALVLAFAGPYRTTDAALARETAIVLDVSSSMGARSGTDAPTRLELAKRRAKSLVRAVQDGRRAALVLAGPEPHVAAPLGEDVGALERALDGVAPTEAPADLAAALELASTLVRRSAGGEVVLLTDGSFDVDPRLEAALEGCRVLVVGDDLPNAGIVAAALRPLPGSRAEQELFLGVASHGGAVETDLVLESATTFVDGAEPEWIHVSSERLVLAAGETREKVLQVQARPGLVLRARLSDGGALAADDEVLLVVPRAAELDVLLISPAPYILGQALSSLDGVRVHQAAGVPIDVSTYELLVVEGPSPDVLPPLPVLAFGATSPRASSSPLLTTTGTLHAPRLLRGQRRHPALRHVDFDPVQVAKAHRARPPLPADVLLEAESGPLAFTWERGGGRVLAFAFDLTDTDLPLRVAFPVLVSDAVDWLADREPAPAARPTGRRQEFRVGAATATLADPSGRRVPLDVRSGVARIPPLTERGLARLDLVRDGVDESVALSFALLSPEETRLSRRVEETTGAEAASLVARERGRRFAWPWAVAAALAVLLLEWAFYQRNPA